MSASLTSRKELKALLSRVEHVLDNIPLDDEDPDLAHDVYAARQAMDDETEGNVPENEKCDK